jgi:NADH-quinone oxidoreductase subunit G
LFNTTIAGIEQADAILLVGTNPRWEAAIVNARIRKAWFNKRVKIGSIGPAHDLGYPVRQLGTGIGDLQALLSGKGEFAAILEKAERPMIILGMGALQGGQGEAVQGLARAVAEKFGMVKDGWNGFNILHTAASRVGALDIGFVPENAFDLGAMDFVWLLGADDMDISAISPRAFVVYQGHHGDVGAARADVILPGAAYTEKDGLYVNLEGRVQRAQRAVSPPGEAREDWKIIRALSPMLGLVLPYDDLASLRRRIAKEWPHLGMYDQITPESWSDFGASDTVQAGSFEPYMNNFYMPNAICRASETMAKCMDVFGSNKMLEAAE